MQMVSYLAGESWSDSPACTHPVLARMAQVVNDRLPDDDRHLLVPLIGRLFGTGETGTAHERKVLSVQLAVWCGRQVLPLVREADRAACERALDTAEAWTRGEATEQECRTAAAYAATAAAYAASYATAAAYAAASAAASATAVAATAATDAAAVVVDLVPLLTGLLDEYDRLTGRTQHRQVTDDDLAALAALTA